jgi:hypothetical protein
MTIKTENAKQDKILEIRDMMEAYQITVHDLVRAQKELSHLKNQNSLSKIFGYIGGAFIFGGFATLIGMLWDDISAPMQIFLTLGAGLLLFSFAVKTYDMSNYARLSTPFFLISAVLQPIGLFTVFENYAPLLDGQTVVLYMSGYMLLQSALTFLTVKQTSLVFIAMTFGSIFVASALEIMDISGRLIAFYLGLSQLLITYALSNSPHRPITGFWYAVGSILLAAGFFGLVKDTIFEVLFIGITGLMIALSVKVRSSALLFMSIIYLLAYISYFTAKYFADVLSWPISLILLGFAFFGLSKFALRLNAQMKTS